MIPSKEDIREKHLYRNGLSVNRSAVGDRIQKAAFGAMDEYAKEIAIGFIEYYEKFRREESRRVRKYTDEHGMISWVGKDVKDIYDDYINKTPIRSYILPIETFWQYDETGRLRHYNPQTNTYT